MQALVEGSVVKLLAIQLLMSLLILLMLLLVLPGFQKDREGSGGGIGN